MLRSEDLQEKRFTAHIYTQKKKQTANSSYSGVWPAIPKLDKFELYPAGHPKLKSNKKTIKHFLCVFTLICCWQVYFQIRLFVSDDKIWNKFRIKNILACKTNNWEPLHSWAESLKSEEDKDIRHERMEPDVYVTVGRTITILKLIMQCMMSVIKQEQHLHGTQYDWLQPSDKNWK